MILRINTEVKSYPNVYKTQKQPTCNAMFQPSFTASAVVVKGENKSIWNSFVGFCSQKGLDTLKNIKSHIPHNVIVVSGPSGVGKDTIIGELKKKSPGIKSVVSYTTRAPRPGEVDGIDYHYINHEAFDKMDRKREFFQQLRMNGNGYGMTTSEVHEKRIGEDVVINISSETAHIVREKYGKKSVLLFINAPSMEEIKKRLIKRGSDAPETIEKRLAYGRQQLEHTQDFDKVIMNDKLDVAVKEAFEYIKNRHSRVIKFLDAGIAFLTKRIK